VVDCVFGKSSTDGSHRPCPMLSMVIADYNLSSKNSLFFTVVIASKCFLKISSVWFNLVSRGHVRFTKSFLCCYYTAFNIDIRGGSFQNDIMCLRTHLLSTDGRHRPWPMLSMVIVVYNMSSKNGLLSTVVIAIKCFIKISSVFFDLVSRGHVRFSNIELLWCYCTALNIDISGGSFQNGIMCFKKHCSFSVNIQVLDKMRPMNIDYVIRSNHTSIQGSIISIEGSLLTKKSYLWSPVIVSICFSKGAFVCNFVRKINIWGDTKYYMVQLIQ
jgi:hypothetical protein